MNSDQIKSIVRGVLKVLGGVLIAHGMSKTAGFLNADDTIGIIVALVGFIWSHASHKSNEGTGQSGPPTATPIIVGFLILSVAGFCAACASFSTNVFNAENLAADSAKTATHAFNQFYFASTNGADVAAMKKLNDARDFIYSADKQLANSLSVVESLRATYALNSADTNKTALQIALSVAQSQASNIVWYVGTFK